jgi:hypothetical protein
MPATQVSYVGLDMTLYYNTGTFATPTWSLITNVRDLKHGQALGEADVSVRGPTSGAKRKLTEPLLIEDVFNWEMIYDETDAAFIALRGFKENRTMVEFAFMNGPIATSGSSGFRCQCKIFGWDEEEPLEGPVTVSVTAKPCKSAATNAPSYFTTP